MRFLALSGLALLLIAGVAEAQPPAKPAESAAMADGRQRFEEGLKLSEQGQHEAARLKFSQAWAVIKAPAVLYNLARAEQLSGHHLDALQHFRAFAKMSDPKIEDSQRRSAADNISELMKKLSQIDIQAPPRARVSIDGREVDADLSDPVPVIPGTHTVEAIADGKVTKVTVEAQAGTVAQAKLTSDEPASPPAPSAAAVSDQPPPDTSSGGRSTMGWAVPIGLGVLGVAGVAVGGVFAGASQSSKDESETLRRDNPGLCASPGAACRAYDDKRSSAETQATIAWVGYVGGAVLVAGAVASFFLWPTGEKKSAIRVVPAVGPRVGGASVHVSF